MLLNPGDWSLAQEVERVLDALHARAGAAGRAPRPTAAWSSSAPASIATWPARPASPSGLRAALARDLLAAGAARRLRGHAPVRGLAGHGRLQRRAATASVYGSMRELARREPTFALHVHVGVPDAESAIRAAQPHAHAPAAAAGAVCQLAVLAGPRHRPGLRAHAAVPGLPARRHPRGCSATTPIGSRPSTCCSAARRSRSRPSCGGTCAPSRASGPSRCGSWTRRSTPADTAALVALVQSLARLELEEGYAVAGGDERARSCSRRTASWRPATASTRASSTRAPSAACPCACRSRDLLDACGPHAAALGCETELAQIERLAERGGAERQVARARADDRLPGLVEMLADTFCERVAPEPAGGDATLAIAQP